MIAIRDILLKLCRREDLTRDEARDAFLQIMSGTAAEAQIGGLLVGLAAKGTCVDELVGAASVMREKVVTIPVENATVLDTCGTGGDVRHTFNISTAAALVAAAAGGGKIKIVKHGNRSASGRVGSADVLEKLGVNIDCSGEGLQRCLAKAHICFAFSRQHHPAMQHVAAARKAIGIPTIFNLLGPLTNPGRARHQLLGVFAPELTDRMAAVLRELGSERAWVVHAEDGLDEISTLGRTRISELREGHVRSWTLDPADLGIPYARLSDLQVDSLDEAAEAMVGILSGQAGAMRDITVLNAAAALVVAEVEGNLRSAVGRAQEAIDDGAARETLEQLVETSNGR